MAVRYVSRHHSPEDPGGLIAEALALGADFPGPAEDLLLAWSLRLADDLPAQEAARRLIERHGLATAAVYPGAAGRLVELLRQAAASDPAASGRRRGGWRGRRS
ncbi:MAG TPA: hypothetical protein VJL84_11905 [Kiloniellales bacterium]|nr:hypothetical protein [Kiloniellales bacterium]